MDGVEDLLLILNDLNKNGVNVFVISHKGGLEDKLRSTVRVKKVNQFSRFEIENKDSIMTDDFKQEIISELALQLLPTVYDKAIHITESDRFFRYEDWRNDIVAESFKLAEAYYNYKDEYLKE